VRYGLRRSVGAAPRVALTGNSKLAAMTPIRTSGAAAAWRPGLAEDRRSTIPPFKWRRHGL
jgi:hypothetical protein